MRFREKVQIRWYVKLGSELRRSNRSTPVQRPIRVSRLLKSLGSFVTIVLLRCKRCTGRKPATATQHTSQMHKIDFTLQPSPMENFHRAIPRYTTIWRQKARVHDTGYCLLCFFCFRQVIEWTSSNNFVQQTEIQRPDHFSTLLDAY